MIFNCKNVYLIYDDIKNKGFFHLLFANFLIGFLSFGSQILVAKFLNPIEIGQVKTIQSFIGVATILAGFGFNTAVLKMCSEKRSQEEKSFIFKKNFFYSIIPIILILIILYILAKVEILSPDKSINKWLLFYMFIIPASTYSSLIIVYLQSLKKIKLMANIQIYIRLFCLLIVVIVTYYFNVTGFIISSVIAGYISLIPLLNFVKNDFKSKIKADNIFIDSFYYAKWSFAANLVGTIGMYVDIFMLNYYLKDRVDFGYYGISTIFILGLSYITITVQSIATPYFSEKSKDKKEFMRILKKYEIFMIFLSLIVGIFGFIIIPPLINIIFGIGYESSGIYFRILIFKYIFTSFYALFGVAIWGMGEVKYNFISSFITVVISFVLSFYFIKYYGTIGASIAQSISSIIGLIITIYILKYVIKNHFRLINV